MYNNIHISRCIFNDFNLCFILNPVYLCVKFTYNENGGSLNVFFFFLNIYYTHHTLYLNTYKYIFFFLSVEHVFCDINLENRPKTVYVYYTHMYI